jgi:hypothetical protein
MFKRRVETKEIMRRQALLRLSQLILQMSKNTKAKHGFSGEADLGSNRLDGHYSPISQDRGDLCRITLEIFGYRTA